MDPIWQYVISGIISVFGGGVVAWYLDERKSRRDKPKTDSEVAHNYADSAESSANAAKASADFSVMVLGRISALEATQAAQQKTINAQQRTIALLRGWAADVMTAVNVMVAQLRELGQEPRSKIPPLPVEVDDKNGS